MYYYPQGAIPAPQFAPQGWVADAVTDYAPVLGGLAGGLTTAVTESPVAGGVVGGLTTSVARNFGHLIPFQAGPGAPVQYVPQGAIGSALGGALGGVVGNHFGHRDIGSALGGLAGSFLPFQAGPGYAPQGMWGNMIADVAPVVGQRVGGNAGRIISTVGGLAEMLPFQAGPVAAQPVYAPQGMWGNLIAGAGQLTGNLVGGDTGRTISQVSQLGNLLPFQAGPGVVASQPGYAPQGMWGNLISGAGRVAGDLVGGNTGRTISQVSQLGNLLPFQAGPGAAYAPQAFNWGDMIANVAPVVGQHVGGNAGRIISTVGGLADMLPFQAGPGAPVQFAPQGAIGSALGGALGGVVGNHFGHRDIGSTLGGLAGCLLPFQAGPGVVASQPGYAPQGLFGNIISGAGQIAGNLVGGNTGRTISQVSQLGNLLPFQAGPTGVASQPMYAPQGILGGALGSVAGGLIGNALGNRGLGSAIGGIAGGFLPFQAGPGAPVQYVPVPAEQIVYH